MDADRFDSLARTMMAPGSRRTVVYALVSGVLGLQRVEEAEAHNALLKCKKIKEKNRKKKCVKTAKRHNRTHDFACPDDGNPCTDDVYDAGTCSHPAKADGTDCGGGNQCRGGVCVSPSPAFCAGKNQCANGDALCDANGPEGPYCYCWITAGTGEPFCGQSARTGPCSNCLAEETCIDMTAAYCERLNVPTGCSLPCPNPRS